ncbi:hypothetical protein C1645_836317 [Glomus cerebriforme]|uniref:Uncharacterized protein n=1 Tax=Glomus cerebriforme TaxID=658196 RepID=A0A397SHA7_9GLOM|nr:hypothetical protein C1645_836317 [Glomus cerebriforme]
MAAIQVDIINLSSDQSNVELPATSSYTASHLIIESLALKPSTTSLYTHSHNHLTKEQSLFIESQLKYIPLGASPNFSSPFLSIPFTVQVQAQREKKAQRKKEKYATTIQMDYLPKELELEFQMLHILSVAQLQNATNTFKLRVKTLLPSSCPPIISLQSASVGHTHKRNFISVINEEATNLCRLYLDLQIINASPIGKNSVDYLMDWQDNFHAYMSTSPVTTLAQTTFSNRKNRFAPIDIKY